MHLTLIQQFLIVVIVSGLYAVIWVEIFDLADRRDRDPWYSPFVSMLLVLSVMIGSILTALALAMRLGLSTSPQWAVAQIFAFFLTLWVFVIFYKRSKLEYPPPLFEWLYPPEVD